MEDTNLVFPDKFREKFYGLMESLTKIQDRRRRWKEEKKSLLETTLKQITQEFKYDWAVQVLDDIDHLQTINICLHKKVEFIEHTSQGSKSYLKHSGFIAFSQTYNGKVAAYIRYPYIEHWETKVPALTIAVVDPEEISEDWILSCVIIFFEKMTDWENGLK